MQNQEIYDFILTNGDCLENKQMASALNVKLSDVTTRIVHLKRRGEIDNDWLLTDRLKNNKAKKQLDYKNVCGNGKKMARAKMVEFIKGSKLYGLILTLPSFTCAIEKELPRKRGQKGFSFFAVDTCMEVIGMMIKAVNRYKLKFDHLYMGKICDVINTASENQFAHLILDYCGTLGTTYKEIRTAMQNNIMQVGGTMHITLNRRISFLGEGFDITNYVESIVPYTGFDDKDGEGRSLHTIINFIIISGEGRYKIKEVFTYHDTSAMVLLIIERIK
jgi:hypothetical protein